MQCRYIKGEIQKIGKIFGIGILYLSQPYDWRDDGQVQWDKKWYFIGLSKNGLMRRINRRFKKIKKKYKDSNVEIFVSYHENNVDWA